jgi:hypothetical protein
MAMIRGRGEDERFLRRADGDGTVPESDCWQRAGARVIGGADQRERDQRMPIVVDPGVHTRVTAVAPVCVTIA